MSFIYSPFPSCFRQSKTTDDHHPPPPPPTPPPSSAAKPNLTTYIYHTDAGTVSLTWSRSILGRSLNLHLHDPHHPLSFQLHIKPFIFFWKKKKQGSKKLLSHNTRVFWNLSKARFGSEPEPHSGFYVALVVDDALTLLVGDDVVSSTKCKTHKPKKNQVLMMKKEHVDVAFSQAQQHKVYSTTTRFGGKVRELEIDYDHQKNTRLLFCVDGERVLVVERLKWKFRGNEKVEVDGVPILISWDVHDWVFEKNNNNNSDNEHAVFMFKFEENEVEVEDELVVRGNKEEKGNLVNLWSQQNWSNLGSYELGKTGKSLSSSSVSVSSSAVSSFGGSSSVMEWSSVEENELVVPVGFSLLVYAWKR